jgi:hypothetical protein
MSLAKHLMFKFAAMLDVPMPIRNPVIVYQMGKVASSSIYQGLKAVPGVDVFHAHYLLPENIERNQAAVRARGFKPRDESRRRYLYRRLLARPDRRIHIITLVREPIGRNVSAYFQNLETVTRVRNADSRLDTAALIQTFLDEYPHDTPLNWFDLEFKPVTAIDVYEHPFAVADGYSVIEKPPFRALIMRSDLNDQSKQAQVRHFLGIPRFSLPRANVGEAKRYGDAYRRMLGAIKLSAPYADRMLGSRYARHFFSKEELAQLRERWTEPAEAQTQSDRSVVPLPRQSAPTDRNAESRHSG